MPVCLELLARMFVARLVRFLGLPARLIGASLTGVISRLGGPIKCIVVAFCLGLVTTQNAKPEFLDSYNVVLGEATVLHTVEMLRAPHKRVPSEVKTTHVTTNYVPVAAVLGVFDNCVPVLGTSIPVDLFIGDCRNAISRPFLWLTISFPIVFALVPGVASSLFLSACDGKRWWIMGWWRARGRTRSL
jgi:hypothetical protein